MRRELKALAISISFFVAATPAQTQSIPGGFNIEAYRDAVMGKESSNRYHVINEANGKAAGAYQFMPSTLAGLGYVAKRGRSWKWTNVDFTEKSQAMGVNSLEDMLTTTAGHRLQDQAFSEFTESNWRRLSTTTKSKVGKVTKGVLVTEGGLLSGAHFLGGGGMNVFVHAGFTGANLNRLGLILKQNFPSEPTLARLDRYVMSRIVSGAAAHGGISGASGYGGSATAGEGTTYSTEQVAESIAGEVRTISGHCLVHPIMSEDGQRVSSPYGVDRTGRASKGWHQGLDMVNKVGKGDPIYAGVNGKVITAGSGSGGNRVVIETSDGSQRFLFMHLDSVHRDVRGAGATVTPETQIGTMGDSGSPGAIHLHLGTVMQGEKLQSAGVESRIWKAVGGWGGSKGTIPLTADQISSALPSSFYFINPEPFLPKRIEFPTELAQDYASQGISRPDGLTLPNNCSIGDLTNMPMASGGGMSARDMSSDSIGHISDVGYAADMAMGEVRDAAVDLTKIAVDNMRQSQLYASGRQRPKAAWGTLVSETIRSDSP